MVKSYNINYSFGGSTNVSNLEIAQNILNQAQVELEQKEKEFQEVQISLENAKKKVTLAENSLATAKAAQGETKDGETKDGDPKDGETTDEIAPVKETFALAAHSLFEEAENKGNLVNIGDLEVFDKLSKRIKLELAGNKKIKLDYKPILIDNNTLNFDLDGTNVGLHLPKEYPFKPPKIIINNVVYIFNESRWGATLHLKWFLNVLLTENFRDNFKLSRKLINVKYFHHLNGFGRATNIYPDVNGLLDGARLENIFEIKYNDQLLFRRFKDEYFINKKYILNEDDVYQVMTINKEKILTGEKLIQEIKSSVSKLNPPNKIVATPGSSQYPTLLFSLLKLSESELKDLMQKVYGNMNVSVYFPKLTSQHLVPIFYIPDKLTMFSQKLKEKGLFSDIDDLNNYILEQLTFSIEKDPMKSIMHVLFGDLTGDSDGPKMSMEEIDEMVEIAFNEYIS